MTENKQNNGELGKMLKTLNNRRKIGTRSHSTIRNQWPAALSFSMLNKIHKITHKPEPKVKVDHSSKSFERRETRDATLNTISLVSFSRPQTCNSQSRLIHLEEKQQPHSQKLNLFDFIKQEKLVRLEEQKEKLLSTMFNQQTQIHRIDQEECDKPNSINFKAYRFLNRLMDLKEEIYHTTNCRPKTSGEMLRKKRYRQPI